MSTRRRTSSPSPVRPWSWAGAGALSGLLLATILFAPALWLAQALEHLSQGRLVLTQAQGTIWKGSARLQLSGGSGSRDAVQLPQRLNWTLRPSWAGLQMQLHSACCTPEPIRLQAGLRWGGFEVQVADGLSRWPASLLSGLGAPWNTLQLDGQVGLNTRGLSLSSLEQRVLLGGSADVDLMQMSSSLSTLRPIGSYRLAIQGGSTTSLTLQTLEGSLQLSGQGQWLGSKLRFDGVATAEPGREAALSNLLNLIGRRTGPKSILTVG